MLEWGAKGKSLRPDIVGTAVAWIDWGDPDGAGRAVAWTDWAIPTVPGRR